MAEIPRYVVDASVATKWHLSDEELVPEALAVKDDFLAGRINLIGPDQIAHEVASAIINATRNTRREERPTHEAGRLSAESFLAWGLRLIPSTQLLPVAYRLAERFNCSYYDGIYLALAQQTQMPLIHADGNLRGALKGGFPLEVWIADYQPVRR